MMLRNGRSKDDPLASPSRHHRLVHMLDRNSSFPDDVKPRFALQHWKHNKVEKKKKNIKCKRGKRKRFPTPNAWMRILIRRSLFREEGFIPLIINWSMVMEPLFGREDETSQSSSSKTVRKVKTKKRKKNLRLKYPDLLRGIYTPWKEIQKPWFRISQAQSKKRHHYCQVISNVEFQRNANPEEWGNAWCFGSWKDHGRSDSSASKKSKGKISLHNFLLSSSKMQMATVSSNVTLKSSQAQQINIKPLKTQNLFRPIKLTSKLWNAQTLLMPIKLISNRKKNPKHYQPLLDLACRIIKEVTNFLIIRNNCQVLNIPHIIIRILMTGHILHLC